MVTSPLPWLVTTWKLDIKATSCSFFTLKYQLQSHFDGTVSCKRVNGVSVSIAWLCTTNFSERVGSQRYIQVFNTWHCYDVLSFVCTWHLHYILHIDTDLGFVIMTERDAARPARAQSNWSDWLSHYQSAPQHVSDPSQRWGAYATGWGRQWARRGFPRWVCCT